MNAEAWQQQIVDLESDIRGKEARLAMIPHAKGEALTDHKKLAALEIEEARLPTEVTALKKRLPLLADERERALKTEATERGRELEKQGAAAATQVSESTAKIRGAMQGLLDIIREAHSTWETHGLLVAEGEYLRLRFALSPLQIPAGNRVTPEAQHAFVRQFELHLRRPLATRPWDARRSEWQAEQHRKAEQRRVEVDAARPNTPTYTHWSDGKALAARRH